MKYFSRIITLIILSCYFISCATINFKTEKIFIKSTGTYKDSMGMEGTFSYKYDKNNRLIEEKLIVPDQLIHTRKFKYDEEGKNLRTEINNNDEIFFYILYKYDNNDRVIEKIFYNSENDEIVETTFYSYKENNKIYSAYTISNEGQKSYIFIKYNDNGNMIEFKQLYPRGWFFFILTYEYKEVSK